MMCFGLLLCFTSRSIIKTHQDQPSAEASINLKVMLCHSAKLKNLWQILPLAGPPAHLSSSLHHLVNEIQPQCNDHPTPNDFITAGVP
jgi:hypothetical protein